MDKREINKRLAEFAGFTLEIKEYEASFVDGVKGEVFTVDLWADTEGEPYGQLDFTESLDACFKWLEPKLKQVKVGKHKGSELFFAEAVKDFSIRDGEAETPALALCQAIIKLI